MIHTIRQYISGIVCLLLGGFGLWFSVTGSFEDKIIALPNYNWLAEIRGLEAEGRLAEAEHLADWVLEESDITNREEVATMRESIHRNRTSLWNRARRIVKGFAKGDGTSIEELSGAMVSDFFLWGDVRDLAQQGYYTATGKETDPVIAGLAAVGVATSLAAYWIADPAEGAEVAADASFSLLKTLKKTGHLSKKFCGVLVDGCKMSAKSKSLTKGMKDIVVGMKDLFEGTGAARAATLMKHVDDVDSLMAVSKMAKRTAEPTAILVRLHGSEGVKVICELAKTDGGVDMLAKATRKGPKGLETLLSYTKYGARMAKVLQHKRVQKVAKAVGRTPIAIVSGLLVMIGLLNLRVWRIVGFYRFSRNAARADMGCVM